jgi:hypothetical protein
VAGIHRTATPANSLHPTERRHPVQINPYLSFNGKCEAAFKFYEKALGGRMIMIR